MTQIEELLRTALSDAPTPHTTTPDPLADLERRVGRSRRRVANLGILGIVVLVAAIVVPISLAGRGGSHRPAPSTTRYPRVPPVWLHSDVTGIAVGGGSVWTLEDRATKSADRYFVVRRDPATDAVQHLYPVGSVQDFIAYGLNRVWVWGGALEAGGLHPSERIVAVDPTTGARATTQVPEPVNFQSLVFAAGSAWGPARSGGLLRLRIRADRIVTSTFGLTGARWAAPISSDEIVVGRATGDIEVAPTSDLVKRLVRGLSLLVPAPNYGVWTAAGRELSYAPRFGDSPTLRFRAPSAVVAVAGDPSMGVYVGLANGEQAVNNPYLAYYSPAVLDAAHPRPTARLLGNHQISQVLLDPAGGVIAADLDQQLLRWDPTHGPSVGR